MNWSGVFGRLIRAGQPDQNRRRWIQPTPQDTRRDVTNNSRSAVLGMARYFYYNNPVVRGAIDSITRNSIGPGIKAQARTADEGWNKATEEWMANWSLACDVRGILDWSAMQQVACRSMLRDNEVFLLLTDNGDGYPMIQMVESHRCETPNNIRDPKVIDGVRVSPLGRPLSYYLKSGNDGETYTEVQAADVIVLAERDRPDELRSLSRLVTCVNLLQDRDEILDYTMQAAKRAGQIGLALEGDGSMGFFGPENTSAEGITTDAVMGGGAIWNLPAGRKIVELKDERPSQNIMDHMDQYLRAAAAGLGLPYEYMWKADLSGPSQRFVLAQAQRRFDEVAQAIITQMISRVRLWALAKAIKRGDLTPPKGMNKWWNAVYHTPQRTTIDAGRDSAADREDLKLGIRTLADISAERGDDWQEIVDQKIAEQVYIKNKCLEAGIPVSDIQFIPNNTSTPAAVVNDTPPSIAPAQDNTVTPALEAREVIVNLTMAEPEPAPAPVTDPAPAPSTDTYTMRDDADFTLTKAEQEMIVSALGIGKYRPKSKKRK